MGQSTSADYSFSYGGYVSALTAASAREPKNTVLSSAVANLSSGNMPGSGGGVLLTSANARVGLGLSGASGCFNSGGAFVNTCGQSYDGLVTLTTSFTLDYGMTPVSGQYSAIDIQRDRRGRARNQRNPGRRRSGIGAERDRGGQHGLQ